MKPTTNGLICRRPAIIAAILAIGVGGALVERWGERRVQPREKAVRRAQAAVAAPVRSVSKPAPRYEPKQAPRWTEWFDVFGPRQAYYVVANSRCAVEIHGENHSCFNGMEIIHEGTTISLPALPDSNYYQDYSRKGVWKKDLYEPRQLNNDDLARTAAAFAGLASFPAVDELRLTGLPIRSPEIMRISAFPGLRYLAFRGCHLIDVDFADLQPLSLREMACIETPLSESHFQQLQRHESLEKVTLHHVRLSVEGVTALARLPHLKSLNLSQTGLTADHLAALAQCGSLRELIVWDNALDDDHILELCRLRQLTTLRLAGNEITDASLVRLARMGQLQELDLSGSEITDSGLIHLRRLRHLKSLQIYAAGDTRGARFDLQQALPRCEIHFFGWGRRDNVPSVAEEGPADPCW